MWQRTTEIAREKDDGPGIVRGVLATNGEASDGHVLDIAGLSLPENAPMLFGHDDHSGERNLGSWVDFTKRGNRMAGLGDQSLLAVGRIEMHGPRATWRQDIAHMVDQGHIRSLSIRWDHDPDAMPVERVSLPSDHPAAVDAKTAQGAQRWGLFFEKSRMLEGSVVTLGADAGAVIRAWQVAGPEREVWASELLPLVLERWEQTGDDRDRLAVLEHSLHEMREQYQVSADPPDTEEPAEEPFGIGEVILERLDTLEALVRDTSPPQGDENGSVSAVPPTAPERVEEGAPLAPTITTPRELFAEIRSGLEQAQRDLRKDMRAELDRARGKVAT